MNKLIRLSSPVFSEYLERELRSDHAGETGAVYIYKGMIAVAKLRNDTELIKFAKNHLATEVEHLKLIESILEPKYRSYLLIAWRIAGWLTGALPSSLGQQSAYATIASVETFVEQHYQQQIDYLQENGGPDGLLDLLLGCQADEIQHKNEAKSLGPTTLPLALRIWCFLVGKGSAAAVVLARKL
jgi:ubiquinone biosynthesis monooxygenase Coq7